VLGNETRDLKIQGRDPAGAGRLNHDSLERRRGEAGTRAARSTNAANRCRMRGSPGTFVQRLKVMAVAGLVGMFLNGAISAMMPLTNRHQHARIPAQGQRGEQKSKQSDANRVLHATHPIPTVRAFQARRARRGRFRSRAPWGPAAVGRKSGLSRGSVCKPCSQSQVYHRGKVKRPVSPPGSDQAVTARSSTANLSTTAYYDQQPHPAEISATHAPDSLSRGCYPSTRAAASQSKTEDPIRAAQRVLMLSLSFAPQP